MLNLKKNSFLLQYTYLLFRININLYIAHLKKNYSQFFVIIIVHSITGTIVVAVAVVADIY